MEPRAGARGLIRRVALRAGTAVLTLLLVTALCSRGIVASARVSLALLSAIVICIAASLLCVLLPPVHVADGGGGGGGGGSYTSNFTPAEHTGFNLTTFANNARPELQAFAGSTDSSLMLMFVLIFPGSQ